MKKNHSYKISFNKEVTLENCSMFDYGSIKEVRVAVENQSATAYFEMSSLKAIEDFITFQSKVFHDIYRKILLFHVLSYNSEFCVTQIIFEIDGIKTLVDDKNDSNGNFPYMFSMIRGDDLRIDKSWKTISNKIMTRTKSKAENDLRFSAIYSFLASKGREYEIDRFSNLWTSMNAYYSYISSLYEKVIKEKYELKELNSKFKLVGKDADSMGAIIWLMGSDYPNTGDSAVFDGLKKLWKHNYSVERFLSVLTQSEIKELYEVSLKDLKENNVAEKYAPIKARAKEFGVNILPFLLILYPYNWRCKYFHGNKTTALFMAYNDYEMGVLKAVNYFLETWLNQAIPECFLDRFWDNGKQNKVEEYICHIRFKGNRGEFEKNIDKLRGLK